MRERTTGQLARMGVYHLEVTPGRSPLPSAGLSPAALTSYWLELVASCAGLRAKRTELNHQLDEVQKANDESFESLYAVRYSGKIEIKTTESILELVHEVLVGPGGNFCDETCPHLAFGATPGQVKAIVDALDAAIRKVSDTLDEAEPRHPTYQSSRDEVGVLERFRIRLAELHGALPFRTIG